MRRTMRVRWGQIQKAREQAKGGREILSPFVFCSHKGRFLHNLAKAWYPALEAAGIEDFRFQDLRHTFASRLAMLGIDLYTVQRAGGWKTAVMVQRYAHLSPDHMRAAVERLAIGTGESDVPEPSPIQKLLTEVILKGS